MVYNNYNSKTHTTSENVIVILHVDLTSITYPHNCLSVNLFVYLFVFIYG